MTQTTVRIPYQCCELLQCYSDTTRKAIVFRHKYVTDVLEVPWEKLAEQGLVEAVMSTTASEAWVWEAHRIYENKVNNARIPGN